MEAFQSSQKFIKIHQYLAQTEELFNSAQQHYIKTPFLRHSIYHEYWPASITHLYLYRKLFQE